MTKRKRFVLVSVLLTIGLLGTQLVGVERRYEAIIFFSGVSVLLSAWALLSDLKGVQWLTLLTLPALYPASVGVFYFFLPESLMSRIILLVLFGIGMYAVLLTDNIYAVASIRTIQLLRAAHAVGFLLTVATAIFLIGTLFGFKLPFWINGIVTSMVLFPLLVQGIWSSTLETSVRRQIWITSIVLAVIGGELAMAVSLIPMIPLVSAIVINGYLYVVLGIMQQELQERLFSRTVQEYLVVGIMVLLAAFYVTYR